jgi:hypothetical protein
VIKCRLSRLFLFIPGFAGCIFRGKGARSLSTRGYTGSGCVCVRVCASRHGAALRAIRSANSTFFSPISAMCCGHSIEVPLLLVQPSVTHLECPDFSTNPLSISLYGRAPFDSGARNPFDSFLSTRIPSTAPAINLLLTYNSAIFSHAEKLLHSLGSCATEMPLRTDISDFTRRVYY